MFNSISNWINTNLPQAMPPVNIPNIPEFLGMNKAPAEEGSTTAEASTSESNQPESTQAAEQVTQPDAEKSDAIRNEGEVPIDAETAEKPSESTKSGINLDIDAQKALGTAKEIGSNLGNMLFSFGKNASTNVMKTATHLKDVIEKKTLIGDFAKENEKFINEKKVQQRREEAAVPPWVGYNDEEKMKEQIMALSSDSRNFLRSPPVGVDFLFDFNVAYPVALATLEKDPNLNEMRFKLVPKQVNEENFWRNYFYRVSLIKQSTQLDQLNNESQNLYFSNEATEKTATAAPTSTKPSYHNDSINANEFVSDSYDHDAINDEEIQSELKQLKLLDNKKGDDLDEWDKELSADLDSISAEELEKEINQMIGK